MSRTTKFFLAMSVLASALTVVLWSSTYYRTPVAVFTGVFGLCAFIAHRAGL